MRTTYSFRKARWHDGRFKLLMTRTIEQRLLDVFFCPLDPHPLPLSYRHEETGQHFYDGDYHSRVRTLGADVDICFGGNIALTEIRLF